MRRIAFLRHGEARPAVAESVSDAARPLTDQGRERIAAEARGMKALGLSFDRIVTSPYVRARQTADVIAVAHRLFDRVVESELLEPGASLPDLEKTLAGMEGESILVVGHAPDLGRIAAQLTGSAVEISLGPGWLACVDLEKKSLAARSGRLYALLPADLLAAAGGLDVTG